MIPEQRNAAQGNAYEAWMARQLEEALQHPLPQRVIDRLALIMSDAATPQGRGQSGS